jgi:hypothetical protein
MFYYQNYSENLRISVGFEVTAVVMKSTIFWDIMPCSPLSVNRRFGGTYHLYLQGRKLKMEALLSPPLSLSLMLRLGRTIRLLSGSLTVIT